MVMAPPEAGLATPVKLVLSDDWELRGDGSGNMRAIQFSTIRRLCDIYEAHGLRGSFNVEVFQQLVHLRLRDSNPELAALSQEWEEVVRETYQRGHDVQLHLHPQWSAATYSGGRWRLGASWALTDYTRSQLSGMLGEAKAYLESLLRPSNPDYQCQSFRAGSWAIAPSPYLLEVLAELGIVFDMSIANGLFYDSPEVRIDYRQVEEPFLPFYPRLDDARRVASSRQPIVCVPTHTFRPRRRGRLMHSLAGRLLDAPLPRRIYRSHLAAGDTPVRDGGYRADYGDRTRQSVSEQPATGVTVSDLGCLTFAQMREALDDIRRRAAATGWSEVPVILENHSKDLGDFAPIERFARLVESTQDIATIKASELADGLRSGRYPARTADAA
jgi:hypothetical protein